MSSNLDSTSSTQSPSDSSQLPLAIATRIPPELLLDIFSIVSDSPSKDHEQWVKRNRYLKQFALVHSTWRGAAQKVLQEEVYFRRADEVAADDEHLKRMPGLLVDHGIRGTKYLTTERHLNDVTNGTGFTIWSQVRYLRLLTGSRTEEISSMSDFAGFPRELSILIRNVDASLHIAFISRPRKAIPR